jgi:hypothetical protein
MPGGKEVTVLSLQVTPPGRLLLQHQRYADLVTTAPIPQVLTRSSMAPAIKRTLTAHSTRLTAIARPRIHQPSVGDSVSADGLSHGWRELSDELNRQALKPCRAPLRRR